MNLVGWERPRRRESTKYHKICPITVSDGGEAKQLQATFDPPGLNLDINEDTERSKREVEAEAVAYVAGWYCGLDISRAAFYLATWESDDHEVVRERLGRISRPAQEIIEVLKN